MCYFNFLTGKAYKANSDIASILSDYCQKNAIAFTGFATITQAKKLFYIVKKGSKGARCPIQIAGGKVHYFTLFPLSAFINAHDRRSLAAQKKIQTKTSTIKLLDTRCQQKLVQKRKAH